MPADVITAATPYLNGKGYLIEFAEVEEQSAYGLASAIDQCLEYLVEYMGDNPRLTFGLARGATLRPRIIFLDQATCVIFSLDHARELMDAGVAASMAKKLVPFIERPPNERPHYTAEGWKEAWDEIYMRNGKAISLFAVWFLIFHEAAHGFGRHPAVLKEVPFAQQALELEADCFAVNMSIVAALYRLDRSSEGAWNFIPYSNYALMLCTLGIGVAFLLDADLRSIVIDKPASITASHPTSWRRLDFCYLHASNLIGHICGIEANHAHLYFLSLPREIMRQMSIVVRQSETHTTSLDAIEKAHLDLLAEEKRLRTIIEAIVPVLAKHSSIRPAFAVEKWAGALKHPDGWTPEVES